MDLILFISFVHFRQFPVLGMGLDHYTSQPSFFLWHLKLGAIRHCNREASVNNVGLSCRNSDEPIACSKEPNVFAVNTYCVCVYETYAL